MRDHDVIPDLPKRRTMTDIESRVRKVHYHIVPETTTTICALVLENGYTVIGHSACVDKSLFNAAVGEQIAYVNALDQIWQLEGYLLRQQHYEMEKLA